MAADPTKTAEAEIALGKLLSERPKIGTPYLVLGHMHQANGDKTKAAAAFEDFISHQRQYHSTSISPYDWHAMFVAFKEVGQEADARAALKNALLQQKIDPQVTYANTSSAPSLAATALRCMSGLHSKKA